MASVPILNKRRFFELVSGYLPDYEAQPKLRNEYFGGELMYETDTEEAYLIRGNCKSLPYFIKIQRRIDIQPSSGSPDYGVWKAEYNFDLVTRQYVEDNNLSLADVLQDVDAKLRVLRY